MSERMPRQSKEELVDKSSHRIAVTEGDLENGEPASDALERTVITEEELGGSEPTPDEPHPDPTSPEDDRGAESPAPAEQEEPTEAQGGEEGGGMPPEGPPENPNNPENPEEEDPTPETEENNGEVPPEIIEATRLIDNFGQRLELADAVNGSKKRPVALGRLAKEYVKYAKKFAGNEVLREEFLSCAERAVETIRNSEQHSSVREFITSSKKEADRIKHLISREIAKISNGMEGGAKQDILDKAIEMADSMEKNKRKNSALLRIAKISGDISPVEYISHVIPHVENKIKGKAIHDAINKARGNVVADGGIEFDVLDVADDIDDDYWKIKTRISIAIKRRNLDLLEEMKDEVKEKYSDHSPVYRKLMKAYDKAQRKIG